MVRPIGRGSYGEIWLAQSLTSAWRAIKIVERARFDDERAFDREFDGMAQFEPVSREHEGFVDILHVGRSDDQGYFYYVMELADDVVPRDDFDPHVYQPKTLRSELQRAMRVPAAEAVNLGISLAKSLGALHRHGLVHRDIKPANIIFVAGKPKIADIGLVSPLGQASFVGTEGYVPPEGPGTSQADIYSLGKVLYEIAMGKDRLDFPAVNTELDALPDREMLLRLNQVLWRACAHDPIDRYASGDEMSEDLRRVRDGEPLLGDAPHRRRRWFPIAALLVLLIAGLTFWKAGAAGTAPTGRGSFFIEVDPPGSGLMMVLNGRLFPTSQRIKDIPAGHYKGTILQDSQFDSLPIEFDVLPGQEARLDKLVRQRSTNTATIESTPPGCEFEIRHGDQVLASDRTPKELSLPTGEYEVVFTDGRTSKREKLIVDRSEPAKASVKFLRKLVHVTSTPPGAEIFCNGTSLGKTTPAEIELDEGRHVLTTRYGSWPERKPREIVVGEDDIPPVAFSFPPGSLKIASEPSGAEIVDANGARLEDTNGLPLRTACRIADLPPGKVTFSLRLPGYESGQITATIEEGRQAFADYRFVARPGPKQGEPWENSLGMKFVPVGDVLVGVTLVRVRDFATYCADIGRERLLPDFPQDDNHPVVRVNWKDAMDFCGWLTSYELNAGKLNEGQIYRLPTDLEWSMAAGMPAESGDTPEKRDGIVRDFPWGPATAWPPPAQNLGNFGDTALKQVIGARARAGSIPGYNDGFAHTSPVGSFPPNRFDLLDMSGNVWQWIADSYNGHTGTQKKDWGVLRGGSWGSVTPDELRLGYRNVVSREERDVIFGFRVVIQPDR